MRIVRPLLVLGVSIGVLIGAPAAGAAPQPPQAGAQPTATSDHPSATVGTLVRVQGGGWGEAGRGVVNVQVCGNGGVSRSVDCDLAATGSGAIRDDGHFFTAVTVRRPPKPCPCVLRVTSSLTPYEVRIPIEIPGMPIAPISAVSPTNRALKVSKVSITSDDSIASWFGAAPTRTLRFTLTNTGNVTLDEPAIDLAFGRGERPVGFVASPEVAPLAPGERRNLRVPVPLATGSIGTYRVTVVADPVGGVISRGSATTSTHP